jgi:hypothetical protein
MSQFTNYLETQIANYHRATNMPSAPTVRLALVNGTPGEAGTGGTEITGAQVAARQNITFGTISNGSGTRQMANSALLDFDASSGSTTISGYKIMDAVTEGNALLHGTITAVAIDSPDPVTVDAGDLVVQVGGTADTYLRDLILNWLKGTAAPSAPANLFVSLWNGSPLSGGTDVTATLAGARQSAGSFTTVTDGVFSNSAAIEFGNALAGGTITHIGIHDAASAGNRWHVCALTGTKTVSAGTPILFPANELIISIL